MTGKYLLNDFPKFQTDRSILRIFAEFFADPTYFPGRCAKIVGPKGVILGYIGALHPEVITSFGLTLPCGAVEFNVEPFL
uniref:tRNA_synthFbeta domain-containing protein n=1 Tax=Caenorhabditis japonica TaxID=281687 RepID=A0A8R1E4C9_CAEJA